MSMGAIEVPPTSRKKIRRLADRVRDQLGIDQAKIPIIRLLDLVMPRVLEGFELEVRSTEEMGDNHGLTYPDQPRIILREDVYEGALQGHGRDRFTAAHELGHLLMHRDVPLARKTESKAPLPAYKSSEWQANCFGGELLISHRHLDGCQAPEHLADKFGVSAEAARIQWDIFGREGLIQR